jgi:hypothetical protein
MLLLQGFDSLLWVASGVDQLLIGFVQFVLVEIELRLSKVDIFCATVIVYAAAVWLVRVGRGPPGAYPCARKARRHDRRIRRPTANRR